MSLGLGVGFIIIIFLSISSCFSIHQTVPLIWGYLGQESFPSSHPVITDLCFVVEKDLRPTIIFHKMLRLWYVINVITMSQWDLGGLIIILFNSLLFIIFVFLFFSIAWSILYCDFVVPTLNLTGIYFVGMFFYYVFIKINPHDQK